MTWQAAVLGPAATPMNAPNGQIWMASVMTATERTFVQNSGSVRGYQELSAPLAIPATAEQAGGQAVCLCIASTGRECALLPGWGRISRVPAR
jgi:hypothetical protein